MAVARPIPHIGWPARTDPGGAASYAFVRALGAVPGAMPRTPGPAELIGLEHEYVVRSPTGVVDFRTLIHRLPLGGLCLDPGDVHAHRCAWGGVVTADGAEAEVAIAPIRRGAGFTVALERRADEARTHLEAALPAGHTLEGYSTHLSVSMPEALNVAAAEVFLARFAPGLMLLADRPGSPGLLVRPRPGRLELGVEFVTGEVLRAAAAYVAGAARAIAAALRSRGIEESDLPPALAVSPIATADRFGWGLPRDAFGPDLLAEGRGAMLRLHGGGSLSAAEHLGRSWEVARRHLGRPASPSDTGATERLVAGAAPLPIERGGTPPDVPAGRAGGSRAARRTRPDPFGAILTPRVRPFGSVRAELATWDTTVFALAGRSRRAYANVPRDLLPRFLSRLDRGALDGPITAYLGAPPDGRLLGGWGHARAAGLFDEIDAPAQFVAPELGGFDVVERDEPLHVAATGSVPRAADRAAAETPGAGDRVGKPFVPVTGLPPTESVTGTAVPTRGRSWLLLVPLLLIGLVGTLLVGGGLLSGTARQATPAPTAGVASLPAVGTPDGTPATQATATPAEVTEPPAAGSAPPSASVATPGAAPLIPPAPTAFTGRGEFTGTLVPTGGNLEHEQFGQLAGTKHLVAQQGSITFTSPDRWIAVTGTLAPDGTFVATGTGTYAGYSGIRVEFRGTLTYRTLAGDYTVGVGGGLPGGQSITYHFSGGRTDAPAQPVPAFLSRFIGTFEGAIREHDVEALVGMLNPAVIDLYGTTRCQASIAAVPKDPGYRIDVIAASGPATWSYRANGRSVPVPDVYTVTANVAAGSATRQEVLHFGWSDGHLTWFTMCGPR